MRFTNLTSDTRDVRALGFAVEPGELTPELTDEQAAGFVEQTTVWAPETQEVTPAAAEPTTEENN